MRATILALLIASLITLTSCTRNTTITVGYQSMCNPWKVLIADKALDKHTKKKMDYRKFDSGAKLINAMASGAVDIAVIGSTPAASAMSQGVDMKIVWIMEIIGEAEALVAREGTEISDVASLKGKKVAVPFGSTTHYHLLLAMGKEGLGEKDVEILNMTPAAIVAAWEKKEIDAAFVWGVALENIKKSGKVILSSKDMADKGDPTFDAVVVRTEFLEKNRALVIKFLQDIQTLHKSYLESPWKKDAKEVEKVSGLIGSKPEDVVTALRGYWFPVGDKQVDLLENKIAEALKKMALFLQKQNKIKEAKDSYADYVDAGLAKEVK